ncbi:MAG TPA: hypothetical protein VNU92_10105 [Edaphobacter sp.]|nr:hypothetical protein [Edaphobacter sp.]
MEARITESEIISLIDTFYAKVPGIGPIFNAIVVHSQTPNHSSL